MVIISLSEIIPNALNTINRGMGLRTLGIFTTIFLLENRLLGLSIFTERVRIGFDTFSDTERISAEYKKASSFDLRIYNILSANFSCGITVFSFPLIMKYPPISLRHSPIEYRVSLSSPRNMQKSDCNIIGNLPK